MWSFIISGYIINGLKCFKAFKCLFSADSYVVVTSIIFWHNMHLVLYSSLKSALIHPLFSHQCRRQPTTIHMFKPAGQAGTCTFQLAWYSDSHCTKQRQNDRATGQHNSEGTVEDREWTGKTSIPAIRKILMETMCSWWDPLQDQFIHNSLHKRRTF